MKMNNLTPVTRKSRCAARGPGREGAPPRGALERGDVAASGRRSASKADVARAGRGDARRRGATRVRQTRLFLVSRGTAGQME